jgi:hypothetical protein
METDLGQDMPEGRPRSSWPQPHAPGVNIEMVTLSAADEQLAALLAAESDAWERFVNAPPATVRSRDIPWPDTQSLADARDDGVELPASEMRLLQARWHPDRFTQRMGARLASDERDAVLARVTSVAATVNALRASM